MNMKVHELMTADPACCTESASLEQVARMMIAHDCGEIPIVRSDSDRTPVGVITDRDIVVRSLGAGLDPMRLKAADCMSTPAVTVTPELSLDECRNVMERHQVRRVPVVDRSGEVVGIVAQADIARHGDNSDTAALVRDISQPA